MTVGGELRKTTELHIAPSCAETTVPRLDIGLGEAGLTMLMQSFDIPAAELVEMVLIIAQ